MKLIKFSQSLSDIENPYDVMLVTDRHDVFKQVSVVADSLPGLAKQGYGAIFVEAVPDIKQTYETRRQKFSGAEGNFALVEKLGDRTAVNFDLYMQSVQVGMTFMPADWPDRLNAEELAEVKQDLQGIADEANVRRKLKTDVIHQRNRDVLQGVDEEELAKGAIYGALGEKAFARLSDRLNLTDAQKKVALEVGAFYSQVSEQYATAAWNLTQSDERNEHMAKTIAENGAGKKIAHFGTQHIIPSDTGIVAVGDILQEKYGISSLKVAFTDVKQIKDTQKALKTLGIGPGDATPPELAAVAAAAEKLSADHAALAFALSADDIAVKAGIYDMRRVPGAGTDYVVVLPVTDNEAVSAQARGRLGKTFGFDR